MAVLATGAVLAAGVPGTVVGPAARVIFIHLWFLPGNLLLAVLTPRLVAAHRGRLPVLALSPSCRASWGSSALAGRRCTG